MDQKEIEKKLESLEKRVEKLEKEIKNRVTKAARALSPEHEEAYNSQLERRRRGPKIIVSAREEFPLANLANPDWKEFLMESYLGEGTTTVEKHASWERLNWYGRDEVYTMFRRWLSDREQFDQWLTEKGDKVYKKWLGDREDTDEEFQKWVNAEGEKLYQRWLGAR